MNNSPKGVLNIQAPILNKCSPDSSKSTLYNFMNSIQCSIDKARQTIPRFQSTIPDSNTIKNTKQLSKLPKTNYICTDTKPYKDEKGNTIYKTPCKVNSG